MIIGSNKETMIKLWSRYSMRAFQNIKTDSILGAFDPLCTVFSFRNPVQDFRVFSPWIPRYTVS
jgi:hypothetical protein